MRKWDSNEPKLVEDLPNNMKKPQTTETKPAKILRVRWNPKTDEFTISPNLKPKNTLTTTKRKVLSEISLSTTILDGFRL